MKVKKKVIYIYDAFCPWCYAFTPVVHQLYEKYKDSIEFETLSGGMIIDDNIKTMGGVENSQRLRKSYQRITQQTGVQFGEAFFKRINDEETVMNSEVPAIALAVFRGLQTSISPIRFVHKVLDSIFHEGGNPNEECFYENLAFHFHLNSESFIKNMKKEHFQHQARYDFALAKQLQADAFPRLYLQTSETYFYLISKGYSDFEHVTHIIDKVNADK